MRRNFAFGLVALILLVAGVAGSQPLPTPLYAPSSEAFPTATATATPVAGVAVTADLASPRATVRAFLQAMMQTGAGWNGYRQGRSHLDLDDIPSLVRHEKGIELSRQLFEVLQAAHLDLEQIPENCQQDLVAIYRQPSGDEISVSRSAIGEWRFSRETLKAIPRMVAVLSHKGKIESWQVPAWLDFEFLGLRGAQWFLLGLVPLLAWALAWLATLALRTLFKRRLGLRLIQLRFLDPLRWAVFSLLCWLSWSTISLPEGLLLTLLALLKFLTIFAFAASAFRLSDLMADYLTRLADSTPSTRDNMLVPLLLRVAKAVVVLTSLLVIAQSLELQVWSLFAGFSIVGAMVALAGQETVKNFFGSYTILADQPFAVGDWIVLEGGIEGTVEEVGFRSTRLRTAYDSLITVPNSRFIASTVDNYGARRARRYTTRLNLALETPMDQVEAFCEGLRGLIQQNPMTVKETFQVWVNDLSPYSLQVLVNVFLQCPDVPSELAERHRLLTEIQRLAQSMSLRFAYPTQTLQMTASSQPTPRPAGPPS